MDLFPKYSPKKHPWKAFAVSLASAGVALDRAELPAAWPPHDALALSSPSSPRPSAGACTQAVIVSAAVPGSHQCHQACASM